MCIRDSPLNYAKTSLHILKTFTKTIPEDDREDYEETVSDLEDAVSRVIRIVTDLRAFTRGDATVKSMIPLHQIIRNSCRMLSDHMDRVQFTSEIAEEIEIFGNDNQLCQVFVNLIQNAIHALEETENPKITVAAQATGGGNLIVTLEDNGKGMPDEVRTKIFDPFFTTKDVGVGMGLGLSLTMRIVEEHGGKMTVESSPGQGTEFTLFFSNSNELPD